MIMIAVINIISIVQTTRSSAVADTPCDATTARSLR